MVLLELQIQCSALLQSAMIGQMPTAKICPKLSLPEEDGAVLLCFGYWANAKWEVGWSPQGSALTKHEVWTWAYLWVMPASS